MQTIGRWVKRHPVLTALLLVWTLLCAAMAVDPEATGGAALSLWLVGVAIAAVIALIIDRRSGQPSSNPTNLAISQTVPAQGNPVNSQTSMGNRRPAFRREARRDDLLRVNLRFLQGLESTTRIGVVNMLEPDEEILFVVAGIDATLIGTDFSLFHLPTGRKGFEQRSTASYDAIEEIWVEPTKRGGVLRLRSGGSIREIELSGQEQLSLGLAAVQEIRRLVHDARQTLAEESTPPAESAFVETAHRQIPASGAISSLSLGDMLAMTPTEFEQLTGRALEAMGYQDMKVSGGSGDLAADLIGRDPQGRSVIVQCKRYAPGNKVGSPAIQQFIGMKAIHHKADRGIYVTTADYSQQAIDLANQYSIVLIDGDDLVKLTALLLAQEAFTPTPLPVSPTGNRYCVNCGNALNPGDSFCDECGAKAKPPIAD